MNIYTIVSILPLHVKGSVFLHCACDTENENVRMRRRRIFKFSGRCVFETEKLAYDLDEAGCKSCNRPLQLSSCMKEKVMGLGNPVY